MVIYKGSNSPIILNLGMAESEIQDLEIMLITYLNGPSILRTWTKDDLIFNEENIIIKLSQADTIALPAGQAQLEIKGTNTSGQVFFTKSVLVKIKNRFNSNILGDDEDGTSYETIDIDEYILNNETLFESITNGVGASSIINSVTNQIITLLPQWQTSE